MLRLGGLLDLKKKIPIPNKHKQKYSCKVLALTCSLSLATFVTSDLNLLMQLIVHCILMPNLWPQLLIYAKVVDALAIY